MFTRAPCCVSQHECRNLHPSPALRGARRVRDATVRPLRPPSPQSHPPVVLGSTHRSVAPPLLGLGRVWFRLITASARVATSKSMEPASCIRSEKRDPRRPLCRLRKLRCTGGCRTRDRVRSAAAARDGHTRRGHRRFRRCMTEHAANIERNAFSPAGPGARPAP